MTKEELLKIVEELQADVASIKEQLASPEPEEPSEPDDNDTDNDGIEDEDEIAKFLAE